MPEENNNPAKSNSQPRTDGPPPAPSTMIAPSASRLDDATAPYLEVGGQATGSPPMPASNSFLASATSVPPAATGDLAKLKQQALQNLAPLIDKLDQPPEDRFKTLMMMIQASDNPQYLDEAYAAASGISDEKERAKALLDIVNEINYFSQNQKKS